MKVGVFGNCQAWGLSHGVAALLPDEEVFHYGSPNAQNASSEAIAKVMDTFATCDVILYQPSLTDRIPGVEPKDFEMRFKNLVPYPFIATRVFHPDSHYLQDEKDALILGPMGPYQSGIAVGAYLSGLSCERTVSLYNAFTYRGMGYLDFDWAWETVCKEASRFGYDYDAFLDGQYGCFMHTITHPTISILFETAKQALTKSEIKFIDPGKLPVDSLGQNYVWPVYPGLAQKYSGADREFVFQYPEKKVCLTLPEFVSESFQAFETVSGPFSSDLSDKAKAFIAKYVS